MSVCEFRRDFGYVAGIGLAAKRRLLGGEAMPGHGKAFLRISSLLARPWDAPCWRENKAEQA